MSAQSFAEKWAAFEAQCNREAEYRRRAWCIVDRVLPLPIGGAHGFYEPEAFFDRAVLRGQRKRLALRIFARLRAKAEGGAPYLAVPKNVPHLFGPGDALFDVAAELAAEAAA
jgi:hypothetical protein